MSKVTSPPILSREAIPDAPDEPWLDVLLDSYNSVNDQTTRALRNGLSIVDNTPWKFVTLNMVHGVEYTVKNPFDNQGDAIKAVSVSQCIGVAVGTDGKPTGSFYTLAQPQLQWRPSGKPDGSVTVSAFYPSPSGMAIAYRNAAYNAPAANTVFPFDTTDIVDGAISHDNAGNFTCAATGYVRVAYTVVFSGTAATGFRQTFVRKASGTTAIWAISYTVPATTNENSAGGSDLIDVVAGDSLNLRTDQNSGGVVAMNVGNRRCRISLQYVAPPVPTVGRVTMLFQGA